MIVASDPGRAVFFDGAGRKGVVGRLLDAGCRVARVGAPVRACPAPESALRGLQGRVPIERVGGDALAHRLGDEPEEWL